MKPNESQNENHQIDPEIQKYKKSQMHFTAIPAVVAVSFPFLLQFFQKSKAL